MECGVEQIWREWKTVRLLGEGSFGKVYEIVRNRFDIEEHSAVKIISIPSSYAEVQALENDGMTQTNITAYYRGVVKEFAQEISLMSKLRGHANIVGYEDYEVIERTDRFGWDIYIRMELLTSLPTYLKTHPIDVDTAVRIVTDICCALETCYEHRIVHRDIKPDNIFVSEDGTFKLGDFGVARTVEKTISGLSKKGTYTYMAPEIYKGEPGGMNADIYSLGIVLYRLLNDNREPFLPPAPIEVQYDHKLQALNKRMNGDDLLPPKYGNIALHKIVYKACAHDPAKRYRTPTEFKRDLQALSAPKTEPAPVAIQAPTHPNKSPLTPQQPQVQTHQTDETIRVQQTPIPTVSPDDSPKKRAPEKHKHIWRIALILLIVVCLIVTPFTLLHLYHTQWRDTLDVPTDVAVGDTITFGKFEQDGNKFNGKEPLEWIVLEKGASEILVISKYALYRTDNADTHSDRREWLTTTFCNDAFSTKELQHISPERGNLLSKDAYEQYSSILSLNCTATAYAKENAAGDVGRNSRQYDLWYLSSSHDGNVINIAVQDGLVWQDTSIYEIVAMTGIQDFYLRPVLLIHVDDLKSTADSRTEVGDIYGHKSNDRATLDLSAMTLENIESESVFLGKTMYWPAPECPSVVAEFDSDHTGVDIASADCLDTPINAAADGTVLFAGHLNDDYGNTLIIGHGVNTDGVSVITVYAHCNSLYVSVGDNVVTGQTIATIGKSGDATTPMLHFEVWENSEPVDPITNSYIIHTPITEDSL